MSSIYAIYDIAMSNSISTPEEPKEPEKKSKKETSYTVVTPTTTITNSSDHCSIVDSER